MLKQPVPPSLRIQRPPLKMNVQSIQQQQDGVPNRFLMEFDRFQMMNEATQSALGDVLGWAEETEVPSFFYIQNEQALRLSQEYQGEIARVLAIELNPRRFYCSISSESMGITISNGKPRPPRTFAWDAWSKGYNRRRIQARCAAVKEELVAAAWMTERISKWVEEDDWNMIEPM